MRGFHAYGLSESLPIYVTRKSATGDTAEYSLTIWMTLLVIGLVWLNVVVWGGIGLFEAVRVVLA